MQLLQLLFRRDPCLKKEREIEEFYAAGIPETGKEVCK